MKEGERGGVSGEVDRDGAVSAFIRRIVSVHSANNYHHRRAAVNLTYTDPAKLVSVLNRTGKVCVQTLKALGLEGKRKEVRCLMKGDEWRGGPGG